MKFDLTISIVLYHDRVSRVQATIQSVLQTTLRVKIYVIDNSRTDELRMTCQDPRCEYLYAGRNLGFGNAHNLALARVLFEADYHLVLNPDVYFGPSVLERIYTYMEGQTEVAQVMPKVLYPDGRLQYLCKLLPTPADLVFRRFFPWFPGANKRNHRHELMASGYDKVMNFPFLSGCFMFLRTSAIQEIGFFEPKIFMYMEDADLTRRLHQKFKTVYYPEVSIYHHFAKGSYKSLRLLFYAIHGSIVYFNKWGWITDYERDRCNSTVLNNYVDKLIKELLDH